MLAEQNVKALTAKFNKISEKISKDLDIVEDISVKGNDIIDYVQSDVLPEMEKHPENYREVFDLTTLLQDFNFIRETLRENVTCGKNLLVSVAADAKCMESAEMAQLVDSFADLNRSITDNLKLYVQAYKDLSNIVINMERSQAQTVGTSADSSQGANKLELVIDTKSILENLRNKNKQQDV